MKFHNCHYTNTGQGFFYNVYIHHDENDPFPSGWAFGQGTDPFGLPFLTVPSKGMYDQTIYHEGFHIFQYNANSPGFAYSGDTQWYIESSAQWYMANYFPNEVSTFVEAGAILGNPQLALWHSFANEAPEDPNVGLKENYEMCNVDSCMVFRYQCCFIHYLYRTLILSYWIELLFA